MKYFEDIINYIEENIEEDINMQTVSRMANLSLYEFRRIFSFVTKIPFSEYIRKRRLTLAAIELYEHKAAIGEISGKYGYETQSSFSRAFKEFHGITPSEVLAGNGSFVVMTKISTEIITSGGKDISCTIIKKPSFVISGFSGKSQMRDTECCDDVWNGFYEWEHAEKLCEGNNRIFAAYKNGVDFVECCIGTNKAFEGEKMLIPESKWACFTLNRTDDDFVNEFYKDIINQWCLSSGYRKNGEVPNVEVFPSDMEEEGFLWEIWMPIQ